MVLFFLSTKKIKRTMRTLDEIQKDFDEITKQENALRERRSVLSAERRQVCKYQFEESHNVKHGDLIETKDGRRFFYDDVSIRYGSVYIMPYRQEERTAIVCVS